MKTRTKLYSTVGIDNRYAHTMSYEANSRGKFPKLLKHFEILKVSKVITWAFDLMLFQ